MIDKPWKKRILGVGEFLRMPYQTQQDIGELAKAQDYIGVLQKLGIKEAISETKVAQDQWQNWVIEYR